MKLTGDDLELSHELSTRLASCGVSPDSLIVVGCSGGCDSTALLALLVESGFDRAICAHFDHGLRGSEQADADAELVRELAESLGVAFETGSAGQGRIAREAQSEAASLEERARRARYRFLEDVCRRYDARFTATGHTQDDQVETVIMRLMQGSDVEGLRGMSACSPLPSPDPSNVTLVRPLLDIDRARLRAYLEAKGIPFIDDPSNTDTKYLRNAVRRNIIPEVERVFPGFRESVSRASAKLGEVSVYLQKETETALSWERALDAEGAVKELRLPRARFFAAPSVLQRRALFHAFNELGAVRSRVPYRFVESIPRDDPAPREESGSGRRILARGHGLVVELQGRVICCRVDIVPRGEHGYLYPVARAQDLKERPDLPIVLNLRRGRTPWRAVRLAAGSLSPPLIARSRRPGDAVSLPGGSRMVKRVVSDLGIPVSLRDTVPILEDRKGIVGILAESVGHKNVWRSNVASEQTGGWAKYGANEDSVTISVDINEVTKLYAG